MKRLSQHSVFTASLRCLIVILNMAILMSKVFAGDTWLPPKGDFTLA